MKYYETLYIIHPALDSGRIKEIILSMNKVLEKNGGKLVSMDVWGKKKLAYEIDKQKYGTYVLVQFTGDGHGNSNLNIELEHNPNVLAYLTVIINENKIRKQSLSLEEQIRGDNPSVISKSSNNAKDIIKEESSGKDEEVVKEESSDKDEEVVEEESSEKDEESIEEG